MWSLGFLDTVSAGDRRWHACKQCHNVILRTVKLGWGGSSLVKAPATQAMRSRVWILRTYVNAAQTWWSQYSSHRRLRQETPKTNRLVRLTILVSSGLIKRTCLNEQRRVIGVIPHVNLGSLYINAHKCTCTHIHKNMCIHT